MGYACCFCSQQFQLPAELKTHTESHDSRKILSFMQATSINNFHVKLDITNLKCKMCNTSVVTLDELIEHLKWHGIKIYSDIKSHIIPFRFEDGTVESLKCCICELSFNRFKCLQEHMNVHFRNYVCPICSAGFVTRRMLNVHSGTHKKGEHKCKFCAKVFATKTKAWVHEKSSHKVSHLLHKCGHCGERFSSYIVKDKHMQEVHDLKIPIVKCKACDKTFSNMERLRIHTKRDHLLERTHECVECNMKFFKGSELRQHSVKHSSVKEFSCDVCSKAFARKKTLVQHKRIHNNDRRFKCEHCGQAFVQKCSWKGHMRAKHGEIV